MILITVARKPMSASVAAHALKCGTGALNIDGCRISYEHTANPATNPLYRMLAGYANSNSSDKGSVVWVLRRQGGGERNPNPFGRWPSNLIFVHRPECVCSGIRRVRNPGGVPKAHPPNPSALRAFTSRQYTSTIHHFESDGRETMAAWECIVGCPVAGLDKQSGICPVSGAAKTGRTAHTHNPRGVTFFQNKKTSGAVHDDAGYASRFFKQVQKDPDYFRAEGRCLCLTCGEPYRKHPRDHHLIARQGEPWLHVLCDGQRVKL